MPETTKKRMGRPPKGPKPEAICLKVNPDTAFRFRRIAGTQPLCDTLTRLVDKWEGKETTTEGASQP